jgi:hypothetical protein
MHAGNQCTVNREVATKAHLVQQAVLAEEVDPVRRPGVQLRRAANGVVYREAKLAVAVLHTTAARCTSL